MWGRSWEQIQLELPYPWIQHLRIQPTVDRKHFKKKSQKVPKRKPWTCCMLVKHLPSIYIVLKDWCWSWSSSTLATSCEELTHWKRPWCWKGLGAGREGDDRGWDGWMASQAQWTWVWVNSGSWWWTGRPGVLWFLGSQRVGHDWVTELNWMELNDYLHIIYIVLGITSNLERLEVCRRMCVDYILQILDHFV